MNAFIKFYDCCHKLNYCVKELFSLQHDVRAMSHTKNSKDQFRTEWSWKTRKPCYGRETARCHSAALRD